MQQYKFRFWDGEQMIYNGYMEADCSFNGLLVCEGDTIALMWTGLKDKNGKKIYEADVLLVPDEDVVPVTDEGQGPIEPCNHIVKMEFKEGQFGFQIPLSDDGETGWKTWGTWGEYSDPHEIEVIGNIYENPELLQDPISSNER